MKVFVSWSGDLSRKVATILKEWFERNVQGAEMWISTDNIGAGAIWFQQIKTSLDQTSIGIVCLTRSNRNNPWILFEAGALAKGTEFSRVCTLLIDLKPGELQPPLSQFNATSLEKAPFKKLVQTINAGLQKQISDGMLEKIIESTWDELLSDISAAISQSETAPEPEKMGVQDSLIEITRIVSESNQVIARQQIDLANLADLVDKIAHRAAPELALAKYFGFAEKASLANALKSQLGLSGFSGIDEQQTVGGGLLSAPPIADSKK